MQKGLAVFLGAWMALMASARGDIFTINPAQSVITLSGTALGSPITGQTANSLSTSYTGSIDATVGPGSIQFNGASFDATVSGTYQPAVGGGTGSAPGDYGGTFASFPFTGLFAVRDFIGSLTSGSISLTGGTFDASQLLFLATSGSIDYSVFIFTGNTSAVGNMTMNGPGMGSIAIVNGVQTLSVPIDVTLLFTINSPNDTILHFTGNLVATAVPEPATYLLFGIGLLACAQRFRRGKRS